MSLVTYELRDHIATITLNRPEARNAINGALREDLNAAWNRFRDDQDAWVGVLTAAGAIFIIPGTIGLAVLFYNLAPMVVVLLVLFWLQVILFRGWLEAPSVEGRRLLDAAEGYREYLQLAESETLARAADAPAMSIALYEQHLPHAMALGVEGAWTARFTAALDAGLIDPALREYQPDWYRSRSSFSRPSALTGALLGGLSSATSSAATPPPSPSSSGSSSGGSSGGGSSGGGGGGGGGGGW